MITLTDAEWEHLWNRYDASKRVLCRSDVDAVLEQREQPPTQCICGYDARNNERDSDLECPVHFTKPTKQNGPCSVCGDSDGKGYCPVHNPPPPTQRFPRGTPEPWIDDDLDDRPAGKGPYVALREQIAKEQPAAPSDKTDDWEARQDAKKQPDAQEVVSFDASSPGVYRPEPVIGNWPAAQDADVPKAVLHAFLDEYKIHLHGMVPAGESFTLEQIKQAFLAEYPMSDLGCKKFLARLSPPKPKTPQERVQLHVDSVSVLFDGRINYTGPEEGAKKHAADLIVELQEKENHG